jgi:hypothetical protein
VATLCAALRGNGVLRELDLTRNAIRDEGLLALVELLEEEDSPGGGGGGGCSSAAALRVVRVGRNSVASQALRDRLSAALALRRMHDDEAAAAASSPAVPEAPSSPVGTPAPPPELPAGSQQGWQLVEPSTVAADEGPAKANYAPSPASVRNLAAAWVDVSPTYVGTTLGSGFELL